ncbi:MAG TPA: ATP-binding protein [Kiritimatiellia bacterium]|nr:ATP-binding protein [Kiritimatiellia bacterium]HPS08774.1 ATP-binding protein [Kiritimatiellia bacterium]
MSSWWQRRSLRLRLTLWYAAAAAVTSLALAVFVYELVEHRLSAELDRQLRIDFDILEAQLESDAAGRVRWLVQGAHGDEGYARLAAWFEVWSEDKQLVLQRWPVPATQSSRLPAPAGAGLRFDTVVLAGALSVRVMERPARIHERGVVVRVLRDESDMRRTLQEVLAGFALSLPLAIFLSALGGFVVAGRSLAPVGAMAERARAITSESLDQRLPNPNEHDELGQLATVFNQTLQRLQGSFDALKRFTADASHELRTPLTALRTVGEVGLREGHDPAVLRETIASMLEDAQGLNDLIEALLALARIESGTLPRRRSPVRLAELMEEVCENLGILATENNQILELAVTPDLSATTDRLLLRQTLMNVLHNAIRYSPANSRIEMRAFRRNDSAVIEIADQGPGIAPEFHQKIFERFFRIDKGRARESGGTGLGLAIAKLSVEHLGGSITVESELGRGSVFRVVLPSGPL